MIRTPMKRRPAKRKNADPEYVAWIHTLPCELLSETACFLWADNEATRSIEAHHAGDHGLGQRAPDRTCIPLCAWHHRLGPESAHVLGKRFWEHHGIDRDTLVRELNERYEIEHA